MNRSNDRGEKPLAYSAYQALADSYAARVDTKPHNAYCEKPAMLGLLPDLQGLRVLDAGCGPGSYAQALVERGATVDSFDMSDRMLELAGQRLAESIAAGQVRLHHLDMSHPLTAFSDQQFDVVNAPLCCDYVQDWRSLFREFFRVLKPGGHFQFSAGHPASDAELHRTDVYFSVEQVSYPWSGFDVPVVVPSYRRSFAEALNPLAEAGFILEKFVEPKPTEDFLKTDPRRYKILMHRPCFICVSAKKPK